jgi:hypothetical protein
MNDWQTKFIEDYRYFILYQTASHFEGYDTYYLFILSRHRILNGGSLHCDKVRRCKDAPKAVEQRWFKHVFKPDLDNDTDDRTELSQSNRNF